MTDTSISTSWDRIEAWLGEHAPDRFQELQRGASLEACATLSRTIGRPLPSDYEQSLRRHDGAAYLTSYQYLDSDTAAAKWDARLELVGDPRSIHDPASEIVKAAWWHKGLLPFAEDSGGNLLCLDLDPGPKGIPGQVVVWEMEAGPAPAGFDSFAAWLADYAAGLADGKYRTDSDGFIVES